MRKDIAFGGVSRVPGGALSSDGDLCAAVDVCNDGMGLEMLEKPTLLFELEDGEELLCIHEPEGEGKHYITQIVVEGEADNAPTTRSSSLDPITSDETFEEVEGYESTLASIQEAVAKETDNDNGATSYAPSLNTTLAAPTEEGVYLLWNLENGDGTRTIMQIIDISDYGKVTAVQPMGNIIVCNHEGNTYSASLRYYLWRPDDEEYKSLGSAPPFIDISFGLESTFKYYPETSSTFKSGTSGEYDKYGGISIKSTLYTDTVPLWWSKYKTRAWVPPYDIAVNQKHTSSYAYGSEDDGQESVDTDTNRMTHFEGTYSLDGVESPDGKTDVAGTKANWTTMALGAYNKFIAEQTKDNKFVFPFYVRYAIELYDGSLIMHSYPVLMIPNSRGPVFALDGAYGLNADLGDNTKSYEKVTFLFQGRVYGFASELHKKIKKLTADAYERLENWKDLIRGVNIYITPPIYNYKQGGQVLGWQSMSSADPENNGVDPWLHHYTVGRVLDANGNVLKEAAGITSMEDQEKQSTSMMSCFTNNSVVPANTIFQKWPSAVSGSNVAPGYFLSIPQKEELEIEELHDNAGQFYKLASIDFDELLRIVNPTTGDENEKKVDFRNKILTTISNQDIMQDDNLTHDKRSANVLYGYNRRLNEADVTREMHSPLLPSTMFPIAPTFITNQSYSVFPMDWSVVVVAQNGGVMSRLVRHSYTMDEYRTLLPNYLFYPNTAADEVWIKLSGAYVTPRYYRVRLKEHKALNGKFWRGDFYNKHQSLDEHEITSQDERYNEIVTALASSENVNNIVDESNKIYTSETDNPFYVPLGNINIAGGGEVRALAAATQAMSQGQFGQHPMYCFTSEGVWAMTVGDNGGWATIQPVTRDVISEHTMPLSLDSTVVFLTERGLLQLAGSQIKVLSDVLQGADPLLLDSPNFGLHRLDDLCGATDSSGLLTVATSLADGKFPEQAWLAYDYDNARIYVSPQDGGGSWVYNLKSELWTQASTALDRQIVSYPECEAQCGGKVVRISVDRAILGNLCDKGLVITRPIKLADMGLLKRWREIAVRGRFKPYSTAVQVALWGTRDWVDSALVASSTRNRLTRWGGSPYFGHSVALFLTKPNYAMQVAGMDVEVDAEHDNKLR